jgi:Fuc2NAc and GlcNAc transferase
VGSAFLGFSLGVLALFAWRSGPALIWPWVILPGAFVVDSTVTLLRRILVGARWYEAHRSHAYQHAARASASHSKVTLAVAGINVVWLFPLAWVVCTYPAIAPVLTAVAFAPLIFLALWFRAGCEDEPTQPETES